MEAPHGVTSAIHSHHQKPLECHLRLRTLPGNVPPMFAACCKDFGHLLGDSPRPSRVLETEGHRAYAALGVENRKRALLSLV